MRTTTVRIVWRRWGLLFLPSLRSFETVVNWPRLTIDALEAQA